MCMVMELDNEDVDELEIDHVSLDNLADHIVVHSSLNIQQPSEYRTCLVFKW